MNRPTNNKGSWTPEEDKVLRSMAAAGESTVAIAKMLKRSNASIRNRAYLLKIKLARSPPGLKARGSELKTALDVFDKPEGKRHISAATWRY